jgi:nucleotide-binding universal stress UspA family protein
MKTHKVLKKILVALDGSEQSREALRYVARLLDNKKFEVVLFHVSDHISESFWKLEKEAAFRHKIAKIQAWEKHQQTLIRKCMEEERKILIDSGFSKEAVQLRIKPRKIGIAQDIIDESTRDYSAVVVGRRGMSELKDLVIGTVANKLVERLTHIPVWVVGGTPQPGKVLVAMDSSDGAMWALDHVANMLGGSETRITLFHAIRSFAFPRMQGVSFVQKEDQEWIALAEEEIGDAGKAMTAIFEEARKRLVQSGTKADLVGTKIIKGVTSRAGSILSEAEREGFGTIVIGRRGLSKVQEFFVGRVSSKIVQLATNKAVWVVN